VTDLTDQRLLLVKLPVEFSGGITLNTTPVPRRQALDMAVEGFSRQHVGQYRRRLSRPHIRERRCQVKQP
jgi:hypothetical protein